MLTAMATDPGPARGRAGVEMQPNPTSDMVAARNGVNDVTVAPIGAHAASARVVLVNGLLGDPALHLRFRHQRRSLLFDVGETTRLQARIAHQISDLFISHAHVDHIAGFLWLLRSRIGVSTPCRVFGPAGITQRIAGMLSAIEWDRVGERGPVFEVWELDGRRFGARLQAGRRGWESLGRRPAGAKNFLLAEPAFSVRAARLDHGIPVLAFALEERAHLNVRKERLLDLGVEAGPWLEELKRRVHGGDTGAQVALPNGELRTVRELASHLLLERNGEKVVYATDLADTAENRAALIDLAGGAHTLFCEAAFAERDADQARATGHLTARACGEIAAAAGVGQLIPFHLSRRYESKPEVVLTEVREVFPRTFIPPPLRDRIRYPAPSSG
jgi:ribonuclease BN (tRNA processing enzyme)